MDDAGLSALLVAVAAGDRDAFARLYQQAGPLLFAISLKVVRRRDQAEEVLQDGFVRIWRKAQLFDPERGAAAAWLVTIVRRCALDRLRNEQARLDPLEIDDPDMRDQLATEPPSIGARQDLSRCLAQLADGAKRAILLAYVHGLTHDEIAGQLQAPLGTVKSWIRRGLGQLKVCLDQ